MKILFLDVDGVLNRMGTFATKERCSGFIGVDKAIARVFTNWLNKRGDIAIVLSSTWRRHPDMWPCLNQAGITWISQTPINGRNRGTEIAQWIEEHKNLGITHWAIIDDDSDMLDHQRINFVQTHTGVGLEQKHCDALDAIFNRK